MKGYLIGKKPKENSDKFNKFGGIMMLSAWGLAMVASSFLFLYIGYLVDEILGTTPNFHAVFFLSGNRSLYVENL